MAVKPAKPYGFGTSLVDINDTHATVCAPKGASDAVVRDWLLQRTDPHPGLHWTLSFRGMCQLRTSHEHVRFHLAVKP